MKLFAIIGLFFMIGCKADYREILPTFNFFLVDSTTKINTAEIKTGGPIALLYFSPDCEHCQHETESIIQKMDSLKDVRFYMITNDPLERLRVFNTYYKINKYSNITLGWDNQYFLIRHFKGIAPPFLVIYDGKKKMRGAFEGGIEASKIISVVNNL